MVLKQAPSGDTNGRSGSLVEEVDGESVNAYYVPLEAYPHMWAAVMIVP